jgi:PTH2 family peptidyl-tRNA hydrolase
MENLYDIKQVIVWRNDLKVRKGKMVAQCCHASMKAILDAASTFTIKSDDPKQKDLRAYTFNSGSPPIKWLDNIFTKILVYVESEKELMDVYNHALSFNVNMPCSLIIDAGRTEFHGVPTPTCVAVGPWPSHIIDKITGSLPLL